MSIAGFERVQGDVFCDVGGSGLHVISSRRGREVWSEQGGEICTFDKPVNCGYQSARGLIPSLKEAMTFRFVDNRVYIFG